MAKQKPQTATVAVLEIPLGKHRNTKLTVCSKLKNSLVNVMIAHRAYDRTFSDQDMDFFEHLYIQADAQIDQLTLKSK